MSDTPLDQGDPRNRAIQRFASTRQESGDWTTPSTDEAIALADLSRLWRHLDDVANEPAILAMRTDARSRMNEAEPIAPRHLRHPWILASGSAAVAAAASFGLFFSNIAHQPPSLTPTARTESLQRLANSKGVPRTIKLADGSRLVLDTSSAVQLVGWAEGKRRIILDQGRAFFQIQHEPSRPFEVQIGETNVTDVGTKFEVEKVKDGALITLAEGKVVVRTHNAQPVAMEPGERLIIDGDQQHLSSVNVERETEWQSGMISIDDRPVGEVVLELNRYLTHPLVIRDPEVLNMRISGVFRLDDPQGFISALSSIGKSGTIQVSSPTAQQ